MCEVCDYINFWKKENNEKQEKFGVQYRLFSNISNVGFLVGDYETMKNPKSTLLSRNFPLNYCPNCGKELNI